MWREIAQKYAAFVVVGLRDTVLPCSARQDQQFQCPCKLHQTQRPEAQGSISEFVKTMEILISVSYHMLPRFVIAVDAVHCQICTHALVESLVICIESIENHNDRGSSQEANEDKVVD